MILRVLIVGSKDLSLNTQSFPVLAPRIGLSAPFLVHVCFRAPLTISQPDKYGFYNPDAPLSFPNGPGGILYY